jgi:alanine dehydrogenase
LNIAIFKTSLKENEHRVPIYPDDLPHFDKKLISSMIFEENYGSRFGVSDNYFMDLGAKMAPREQLFNKCELLVLPKPTPDDLKYMHPNQVIFGWLHCVQQRTIAQIAIEKKITIIAWEAMHHWSDSGEKLMHIFYKNNEIAGYCAVLHALQIMGMDGLYGPRRKVVVFGFGSVSHGAIYALQGRGFNNINVFTKRPSHLVAGQNPDVYHGQYYYGLDNILMVKDSENLEYKMIDELKDADIICNCILQDTNDPIMFIRDDEISKLKARSLILDISCDKDMGFPFASPTTIEQPVFTIGNNITYYSVDHTPTYLWDAASRKISKALLPFLHKVAGGEDAWKTDTTIQKAIEIKNGVVQNPNILKFQHRSPEYPHDISVNTN